MPMLAASIVIYTLFLTPVFNKRAKPTMSNWVHDRAKFSCAVFELQNYKFNAAQ